MRYTVTGKDSREGKLKGRLSGWFIVAGALAVAAMIVAGLALATTTTHAQEAGATYTGPLEVVVADTCGGGTISLTLNEDGTAITRLELAGLFVAGINVDTISDPPSPLVIDFDPGLAVAKGSFNEEFEPLPDVLPGTMAVFQGTFDGDTVTGSLGIATLKCEVPFSAVVGAAAPTPEPTSEPTATVAPVLPVTGVAGPTGSSGGEALWAIIAATMGAFALGAGALAVMLRRSA